MDQFVVGDPGNGTDQEADDVYRETRNQSQQGVDHSRIRYLPNVFQVDVENEQGDCESDNTVAERFYSAFGQGAPSLKPPNRNSTQVHCMSWHSLRIRDYGASRLRAMFELGGKFD